MIHRLTSAELDFARRKLPTTKLAIHGIAMSVLNETRPGFVVSNAPSGSTAWGIIAPEGGFAWVYLAGSADDKEFLYQVREWMFEERGLGRRVSLAFLIWSEDQWAKAASALIAPREPVAECRLDFVCTGIEKPTTRDQRPPVGYRISSLCPELVASGIQLPKKIRQWGRDNFGSPEALLACGIGSVAVFGDRIVAWCLPDSVVEDRVDVGVETAEPHRRQGLAWLTTVHTLEQAFDLGNHQVGWHCDASNIGSVRTARKAGFRPSGDHLLLPVCLDANDHRQLAAAIVREQGAAAKTALEGGDLREAAKLYDALLACAVPADASSETLFDAARAAALEGKNEIAVWRMEQAIESGWSFAIPLRTRPEFSALREHPRWPDLIARAEAAHRRNGR